MHEKLASVEVNEKVNSMTAEQRENILKNTVQRAAYAGLEKIDAEAKKAAENDSTVLRKDYNATFLGYVMKKFDNKWLVVSFGIGDGIIGLVDRQDNLTLLSEPDGAAGTEYDLRHGQYADLPEFSLLCRLSDRGRNRGPSGQRRISPRPAPSQPRNHPENQIKDGLFMNCDRFAGQDISEFTRT